MLPSLLEFALSTAKDNLKEVARRLRIAWVFFAVVLLVSWIPSILWLERHDSALLDAIIAHDVQAAQQAFKNGATGRMELKHHSTMLQAVAYQGQVEMAKLLFENGAAGNLTATDDDGDTALDIAIAQRHSEMADYLRSLGAIGHAKDGPGP
jgi:hypothetical protein